MLRHVLSYVAGKKQDVSLCDINHFRISNPNPNPTLTQASKPNPKSL